MSIRDLLLAKVANPGIATDIDGVTVYIRALSQLEKVQLSDLSTSDGEKKSVFVTALSKKIVLSCALNEDGSTVFTEADWATMADGKGDTIDKIASAVLAASGMTAKAKEEAGNASGEAKQDASASVPVSPSASSPAK